jgi:uncharacterized delta-60 repeat protein
MFRNLRRAALALSVVAASTVAAEVTFAAESDGTVDLGYGASGIASFEGNHRVALALSDGKLVTFANVDVNSDYNPDKVEIKRFTSSGTLDTTFGLSGTMTIQPQNHTYVQYSYSFADASGGFYLIYTSNDPNAVGQDAGKMIKVTSAGTQDLNFGTGGEAVLAAPAGSQTVNSHWVDATSGKIYTIQYGNVAALHRQNADGTPDTTFGVSNRSYIDWPYSGNCGAFWRSGRNAIWADPTESFAYVASFKDGPSGTKTLGLAKFSFSTRQCDTTFGADLLNNSNGNRTPDGTLDGVFEYSINNATSLNGSFTFANDGSLFALATDDTANLNIVKLDSSGVLDTSFNGTGISANLWSTFTAGYNSNPKMFVLPNNDVRLVGIPRSGSGIARIAALSGGVFDSSFGNAGVATAPSCQSLSFFGANRLPDGSIIVNSVMGTGYPTTYTTYLIKLGSGGSSSQCGTTTTTTTTTQPPMNNPNPNPNFNSCTSGGLSLTPSSRTVTGTVGQALTVPAPVATGFSASPTYTRANGSFWPTGLNLDAATGAISGTPTTNAQYFTSSVSVATGNQMCNYSITWNITAPACALGAVTSNVAGVTGDPTFGGSGFWGPTETGYRSSPGGVIVGNDGNIYALIAFQATMNNMSSSTNNYARLYKMSSAGVVDTTWGTNGYVLLDFYANNGAGNEFTRGLKKLSDGSFVLSTSNSLMSGSQSTLESFVTRVTTAGAIDSTWGTNGKAVLYGPATVSSGSSVYVNAFEVDASDSIFALSSVTIGGGSTTSRIAKVSSTGIKSATFGGSGDLTPGSNVFEFSLDPAGGLYLSGSASQNADATITKYDANGVVDTTFGTSGVATIDRSTRESLDSVTVVGDKIYAIHSDMSSMGMPVGSLIRLQANGTLDTTYGNAGAASLTALGSFNPWNIVPLSGGSVLLAGSAGMQSISMGLAVVDSSGALPSGVTAAAVLTSGTCDMEYYGVAPIVFGDGFLFAGSANMGTVTALVKFGVSGFSGGGSGGGATPTLVTSANQSLLERDPGSEGMIINGQSVTIETTRVEISAARTPASQRTPAQVAAIQAAGQALLQDFLASLPAGAVTNVAVVNTATGAVMRNLVFDADGDSLDVPVEDIVLLDGPAISLMIGSNNANITSDGKYQVGAGGIIGVVGSGLGASAAGELVVMSTPTLIGNFTTSATGDVSESAQLPNSIGVGDHTLVVATGSTYAVMGLRVVPSALPTTGLTEESGRTVVIALFTLVFAAVLVRSRRLTLLAR